MVRKLFEILSISIYLTGNINDDLDFEYGDGADARYGCGATLMDEYWYFGDDKKVNIISICNSGSVSSGSHRYFISFFRPAKL